MDYYKDYDKSRYQERFDSFKKDKVRIDSIKAIILNMQSQSAATKENLVEYRITHDYKHKGLDDEMVNLTIGFTLDKEFKIKINRLYKGINGQGFFDIELLCKNGGSYFIEFVVDPKFDDQIINSDGTTDLHVKSGEHYVTWTASPKNGFGLLTDPKTFGEKIILEDSKFVNTYFVINGKSFWQFKSKEEAEKDDFYVKFIMTDGIN